MSNQAKISSWLAWRDWKHEIFLSLCAVLALISMLTPILVLIGLKNGVIDGMRKRLLEDPAIMIITPKSDAGQFSREFIAELARLPGANFAIGRTRATATDFTFANQAGTQQSVVTLEPAAPGEPVLKSAGAPVPTDGAEPEIVLSNIAANALNVTTGDKIQVKLGRRTPEHRLESVPLVFRVSGILGAEVADRRMGFVPLQVLEDIENYHDYIAVPSRGFTGDPAPGERKYSSFRLYAKNLDSVESLVENLRQKRIETTARTRDIAVIRQLETGINQLIIIISSAIGAGFLAFTVSSVQGSVLRKKKQLALLRLFGLKRLQLMFFPMTQILLTLITGFVCSLGAYWCVSLMIAQTFKNQGELRCELTFANVASIACILLLLSALACAWAAWKSATIEPSTVIRSE